MSIFDTECRCGGCRQARVEEVQLARSKWDSGFREVVVREGYIPGLSINGCFITCNHDPVNSMRCLLEFLGVEGVRFGSAYLDGAL